MRNITIGLSTAVLLGAMAFVGSKTTPSVEGMVYALLIFMPFYGFPPIVSIVLAIRRKSPFAHMFLSLASLLYGVWFAYVMHDAFYANPDPQSPILIAFVGVYALPVLLPLWIAAYFFGRTSQ
jgi:hypothetical protein